MTLLAPLRVHQTTVTSGTGSYSLTVASGQFRNFRAAYLTGAKVPYVATDNLTNFEIGYGTLTIGTPDTISRDAIVASSNGGAAVNWGSATVRDIFAWEGADSEYSIGFAGNKVLASGSDEWANLQVYTGAGGNTLTMPAFASVPLGWSTAALNAGTGNLTLAAAGADTWQIGGAPVIAPQQQVSVKKGLTGWAVLGRIAGIAGDLTVTTLQVTGQLTALGQIIGGNAAATALTIPAGAGLILAADSSTAPNSNMTFRRASNDASGSIIAYNKARGTNAVPLSVQLNDQFGAFNFAGFSGTAYTNSAQIIASVSGAVSSGIVPGTLSINCADAAGTLQNAVLFNSAGFNGVLGATTPAAATVTTLTATTKVRTLLIDTASGSIQVNPANGKFSFGNTTATGNGMLTLFPSTNEPQIFLAQSNAVDDGFQLWGNAAGGFFTVSRRTGTVNSELFRIASDGTTSLGGALGSESFRVLPAVGSTRWITGSGSVAGAPRLGTSAGSLDFYPGATFGLRVNSVANSVNALSFNPTPTGGVPLIGAETIGADTFVSFGFKPFGIGSIYFFGGDGTTQFQISPVAGSTRNLTAFGSVAGAPGLSTSAGDLSLNSATGVVQFANGASFAANGAVVTTLTGVGPTGANTTVQEWLVIRNPGGATRYIPAF